MRTAIWRQREYGTDPGFPPPILVRGRYRWIFSDVERHIASLSIENQHAAEPKKRPGRPRTDAPQSSNADEIDESIGYQP